MYENIMVDIETLATSNRAHILSIGAVPFNSLVYLDAGFNQVIKGKQKDREIDFDTVMWWMDKNEEARSVFKQDGDDLKETLRGFSHYIRNMRQENTQFWSRGMFDFPILEDAMRQCDIEIPWNFRELNDVRVIERAAKRMNFDNPVSLNELVHHNAFDDAVWQAQQVSYWLAQMDVIPKLLPRT